MTSRDEREALVKPDELAQRLIWHAEAFEAHPDADAYVAKIRDMRLAAEFLTAHGSDGEPVAGRGEAVVPPEIPQTGSPVQKLGARLTKLLDDDQWNNIEPLLFAASSAPVIKMAEENEPVAWGQDRTITDTDGYPIGTDDPELSWGKEPPDETGWWPLYASPTPSPEGVVVPRDDMGALLSANQAVIIEEIKDYEFVGDDGYYTPSDFERELMEDVIQGLIVNDEFLATFNAWQDAVRRYRAATPAAKGGE